MSQTVTVEVAHGTLRGRKTRSKSGGTYYSFQGIPYAKPPLGLLRFKVPEPPEPWSGVRDALTEGSSSTQYNPETRQFEGSEDCLYLNVYSPKLPTRTTENLLQPVMFWIHGGGFIFGSGSTDDYGPDYLVDEGVVLVTINYRLGLLGFICLDDPVAPGNLGMKDQVAALRWVHNNIVKFGGDPNNVTIFGESAGSVSVHLHMMSPMSEGLFSRAIAQSAVPTLPMRLLRNAHEVVFQVGRQLGFTGTRAEELVEFLRGIDHMDIVKATGRGSSDKEEAGLLEVIIAPAVEIEVEGVERFLSEYPSEVLEGGRYHSVPLLTGITDREGLIAYGLGALNKEGALEEIDKKFGEVVLPTLELPKGCTNTGQVISKLRSFFLGNKPLNNDTLDGFIDIVTDAYFAYGNHSWLKKMALLGKAPIYSYIFKYDGKLNFFKIIYGIDLPGACHEDDIGYLFRIKLIDPDLAPDSRDAIARARMVKLWTNFAKTGNPTPSTDPLLPVKWPQYTASNPYYLEINDELSVGENLLKERMEFWEELYSNL